MDKSASARTGSNRPIDWRRGFVGAVGSVRMSDKLIVRLTCESYISGWAGGDKGSVHSANLQLERCGRHTSPKSYLAVNGPKKESHSRSRGGVNFR